MAEREFDVIVVGGGTGRDVMLAAEARGERVALIEKGPLGGTCHNRGCMPTKMLIHSSDVAQAVRDAPDFGVGATIEGIDFPAIVRAVFDELDEETREREAAIEASDLVTFYRDEARFVGPRRLEVGDDLIHAPRIVIAAGSRPGVPAIPGVEDVPYLTSDSALRLAEQPRRLVIVGGGYIAVELAHFFGGLGTEVAIVQRSDRLLTREDGEISAWLTREYQRRFDVRLGATVESVARSGEGVEVRLRGAADPLRADALLVATGRVPNTERLNLDAAGVRLGVRGHIEVDEHLQTSAEGVWAFGDVTGLMELKHVAVRQARLLIQGLFEGRWRRLDYDVVPHAVFSSPQVAGVGRTEERLRATGEPFLVGRHRFKDTGMGMALRADGLVKVLAAPDGRLLGCHIVGPQASVLVQEPALVLTAGGSIDAILDTVHAHPALPQVVEAACHAVRA